jgi:hypothetical protein
MSGGKEKWELPSVQNTKPECFWAARNPPFLIFSHYSYEERKKS